MGDLPKGNSDPTKGGLETGYIINESKNAMCPISVDKANVIYGDEERCESDTEDSQRRGPSSYLYDDHMGPERLG